ncbi:uncharacterized protein [Amphiura filiformis]|uniref:uncharacterized protein n=1 Tax=Amphiura filiformis TaxID=82378 RepID=UPI003B228CDE
MKGFWFVAPISTALVATVFSVISVSTTYWIYQTLSGVSVSTGLWQSCVTILDTTKCDSFDADLLKPLPAVRGLVVLSIILAVFAVASALMAYLVTKYDYVCTLVATGVTALQGITLACGLFTYLSFLNKNDVALTNLSWSFALGWVGVGFYALAFIFFFIQIIQLRKHRSYESQ